MLDIENMKMKCFYCKGDMIKGTSAYTAELNGRVIVVKNVPCMKCIQCGETVFDGTTAARLEALIDQLSSNAAEFAVLNYDNIVA